MTDEERDRMFARMDASLERSSVAIEMNERAFRQLVGSHNQINRTLAKLDRNITSAVNDLREQVHANTEATLKLIDRLGPEPGTA